MREVHQQRTFLFLLLFVLFFSIGPVLFNYLLMESFLPPDWTPQGHLYQYLLLRSNMSMLSLAYHLIKSPTDPLLWIMSLWDLPFCCYCLPQIPRRETGDVWWHPLSGILGLSFDSSFLSPLLFFCLVLLLFPSRHFSGNGPVSWLLFVCCFWFCFEKTQICFVKS